MKIEDILQRYRDILYNLKQRILKIELERNNLYDLVKVSKDEADKNPIDTDIKRNNFGQMEYIQRKYPEISFTETQLDELVFLHDEITKLNSKLYSTSEQSTLISSLKALGWLFLIIHAFAAFAFLITEQFLFLFAVIISGAVSSLLFFSFAEIIRLLLRIANNTK